MYYVCPWISIPHNSHYKCYFFAYGLWLLTFNCFTKELLHISALIICPFVGTSHNSDTGIVGSTHWLANIPIHPTHNVSVCPCENTVYFMIRCTQPHAKSKKKKIDVNKLTSRAGIAHSVQRLSCLTLWGSGTVDPGLEPHQCLCMDWNISGQQVSYQGECEVLATEYWGDPHWLWNPGQILPEDQNSGISGPTKRTDVLQKFKNKKAYNCTK